MKAYIQNYVTNHNGLYVYKNAEKEILYIGKGKPLKNRLYSHYLESFQPVPGDTKDQRWHKFFLKLQGDLDVYWLELETEKDRQIIEKMLDYVLKPLFTEPAETSTAGVSNHTVKPPMASKENENRNITNYRFYNYGEEFVENVQTVLGPDYLPEYNKTGVTFFRGLSRILKLVNAVNVLKIELNVPVTKVDGLEVLTKEVAKAKKMGTCQWIYQGKSLDTAMKLVQEAKDIFLYE
ncbi:hypothetical protein [Neobacillus drentensis]|uniref:hypothetical protein n=1 Tax=Neobacillus drentensis TaxID=220684 RepID=UPI002FFFFAFD